VSENSGLSVRIRRIPHSPGKPSRYEFEYRRHGTASRLAALEVHSAEVLATDIAKNDSLTFTAFLEDIDRSVDPSVQIHLVMVNGSSHTAKATKAWFEQHPRFVAHYTPKYASWVNQVELFFSIITRKVLKRGNFRCTCLLHFGARWGRGGLVADVFVAGVVGPRCQPRRMASPGSGLRARPAR